MESDFIEVVNENKQGSCSWEIESIVHDILQLSNYTNSSSLNMCDEIVIMQHMLLVNKFLGAHLCLPVLAMFHLAY